MAPIVHVSQSRRRHLALLAAIAAISPMTNAMSATVKVSPAASTLKAHTIQQFKATVTGAGSQAVTWLVNGIPGGAPSLGLISATGLYTAPADVPAQTKIEVEAQSVAVPLADGAASVSLTAAAASPGAAFFVAKTGNDTNNGGKTHPWRTIQHGVDTIPAGATLNVGSGIYNELVTIKHSGSTPAGFITVTAAPGASPIVDGANLPIPNGEYGLFTLSNVSFVRVIGFEIRNYISASAAKDPIGIYVIGAGSNIEILRNHVHGIKVTGKTSSFDALGIAIYGTRAPASLNRIVIDGNELNDLVTGFSESLAFSGNVQYWEVTGNTIHDNNNIGIVAAGYEKAAPQTAYDRPRNGLIAGNTVYNISSLHNPAYRGQESADGIYVDGGADVVIERNLVHNTDLGIEAASEHSGRTSDAVTIRNNVIYAANAVGISIGGYANGVGGTSNCTVVNNTLFGNGTAANSEGEFQIQFHATGNVFENNIAEANNNQNLLLYSFVATPAHPATLDRNLYFSQGGANDSAWYWTAKGYASFAKYRTATGNDADSLFADPKFVAPQTFDFRTTAGSPARGAGAPLPLSAIGLFDFGGKPRSSVDDKIDIGAYQN
jgi:hypothetical protein